MGRNLLQVNIKDSDPDSIVLAEFLRSGSVSGRILTASRAYYQSLSVSGRVDSSKEQRDNALFACLSLLKQHMCYLMDFHYRLDGTVVPPESFSNVTINPLLKEYRDMERNSSGSSELNEWKPSSEPLSTSNLVSYVADFKKGEEDGLVIPSEILIDRLKLSQENQERSDEIDREVALDDTLTLDESDLDDDDDLTDEEYGAKMLARIPNGITPIKS